MKSLKTKFSILALLLLTSSFSNFTVAQEEATHKIDSIINRALETFNIPGAGVSVVNNGKLILSKGYGVTNVETKNKVDKNTLFGIASNSKAFTTAALSILVDEGKLKWNDRVYSYIPEFKMYNPYVTDEFTIEDLLTHRSGLGLGAGDLMIFPSNNIFTKKEIIHNLRYLKPTSQFRTKYDYDNLLYIVAGEVIKRVSGMTWEEFIQKKILAPLEMKQSAPSFLTLKDTSNIASPHIPINGVLKVSQRTYNNNLNAAGGIYTNANELSHWLLTQLNKGKYNDKKIFSEKRNNDMWAQHTIIKPQPMPGYSSNFKAYGLGWEIQDFNGHKLVSHTGGLPGMVSLVEMIPELGFGIIVLTNQQSGLGFMAIADMIKDYLLDYDYMDRIKVYHSFEQFSSIKSNSSTSKILKTAESNIGKVIPLDIEGTYQDTWFGNIKISKKGNKLYFRSIKSPTLKGEILYYKANTFIVKWDDRGLKADAYLMFELNEKGTPQHIKMKAISSATDFSYDFQDLYFTKVK